jgi:hypothetical protein
MRRQVRKWSKAGQKRDINTRQKATSGHQQQTHIFHKNALKLILSQPPANKATFPTDAAAQSPRATLISAVDHALVLPSYTSTTLDALPAADGMRRQVRKWSKAGQKRDINTRQKATSGHQHQTLRSKQRTSIPAPSE